MRVNANVLIVLVLAMFIHGCGESDGESNNNSVTTYSNPPQEGTGTNQSFLPLSDTVIHPEETVHFYDKGYQADGSATSTDLVSGGNYVSLSSNGFLMIHPSSTDAGKTDIVLRTESGYEELRLDITKDINAVSADTGKVVTVLPEVLYSQRLESIDIFQYGGDIHVLAWYDLKGRVAHFNLTQKTASEHATDAGRFNVLNGVLVGNRLYKASNDPGYFGYFDLDLNTWVSKGQFGNPALGDKIAKLIADDLGNVYLGTTTRGTLIKYSPSTDSFSTDNPVVDATSWFVGAQTDAMRLHSVNISGGTGSAYIVTNHGISTGSSFPIEITGSGVGLDGIYTATATGATSFTFSNLNNVSDGTYKTVGMRIRNTECKGCYRYVDTIGANNNWVYLSMRDAATNRWWLVIRSTDMTNPTEKVCFEDDGLNATSLLRHSNLNDWVFKKSSSEYLLLNGGTCPSVAVSSNSVIPYYRTGRKAEVYNYLAQPNEEEGLFEININIDGLYPGGSQNYGLVDLKFKSPYASVYQKLSTNVELVPSLIKRYTGIGDGNMIASVGSYDENAMVDLKSKDVYRMGRISSQSTYNVVKAGQFVFFSGYPTSSYLLDITSNDGWTNSPSNTDVPCGVEGAPNPCLLAREWGKYHLYSDVGSDGNYYIASQYERQSLYGGEISWVNPISYQRESYRDRVSTPEYNCYMPEDFISINNGKQFVYSTRKGSGVSDGVSCSTGNGKLFIFDTGSKSIVNSFQAINSEGQGKLVELRDYSFMGLVKDSPSVGKYTVYRAGAAGEGTMWVKTYDGNLFPDTHAKNHRAVRGSDGYVYALVDRNMVKIDPDSGLVSVEVSDIIPLGKSLSSLVKEGNNICLAGDVELRCISTKPQ